MSSDAPWGEIAPFVSKVNTENSNSKNNHKINKWKFFSEMKVEVKRNKKRNRQIDKNSLFSTLIFKKRY